MNNLEPCLVLYPNGKWQLEERTPLPPRIPPQYDWHSELLLKPMQDKVLKMKHLQRAKNKRAKAKLWEVGE